MEQSEYVRRDYRTLHLKAETHHRLMLVKAQMQAQHQKFISQDIFVNVLLDTYTDRVPAQPVAELA